MSKGIPFYRKVQSELDLNGPTLNMQSQPVGASCSVASGIATFTGIGTAIYPIGQSGRDTNTGTITHRWHKVGVGALSDGTNVTGSGTTILTLSGLTSPADAGSEYFCQIGYEPNELSPNAINEPFDSSFGTLTVFPTISITSQPSNASILENLPVTFSIITQSSDGTDNFSYQWVLDGIDLTDGTTSAGTVSGSRTSTLIISRSTPNTHKVLCRVSHQSANPGNITSNEADLVISSSRALLAYERHSGGASISESGSLDLATAGNDRLGFRANAVVNARIIVVYAPEEDITVKITMGGAGGHNKSGHQPPGQGGISVFKTTLKRNDEYMIKLGVTQSQGGGPRGGNSNGGSGGGGIAAIYHKGKLIAVCGGGGGGGVSGKGGDGGGLQVRGEDGGGGAGRGIGGKIYSQGQLPVGGMSQAGRTGWRDFDSASTGAGRIGGCTMGNYWYQQGKSPCEDVEFNHFRNGNGTINYATAIIQRGFKSGQGFRNNGGASGGSNMGAGGAGAVAGSGATYNGAGGGGASGYASDEVELLSSSVLPTGTRLGGNSGVGFICFELFNPFDDHVPCIPDVSPTSQVRIGTVSHVFNNASNTDVSLTTTGSVASVSSMNKGALDGQVGNGWNLKYYQVTMNFNYSNINVHTTLDMTAGGGAGGGLQCTKIIFIGGTTWGIWFNKGNGFNTYARSFSVTGVV